jgi:hypothetical protein
MTYVHYRNNGSMVDDTGFLATDNTTRLGVGQYSAAWAPIQAEWFTSGDGLRKQETADGKTDDRALIDAPSASLTSFLLSLSLSLARALSLSLF